MANFYLDNKDLQYHLSHPLMKRIIELKERNFADAALYDYAPQDAEDALDSYRRVLEIVGDVCGEVIAPNAEGVDHEGPRVVNDHVEYASGTVRNLEALNEAGLGGMTLPRRFGGLNMPVTCFAMANEMVARADTGFENIWGLQDCAETINEFATEDIKELYLPRVCEGETCAMDLTEPDAGSDLGAVMLKASWDEEAGVWRLNGCKRFITNGDGDISLVLARTEDGTKDARGLSMLIYDKRDGGVIVRRIENKLGIKGSPTCELVFNNAPAVLVGDFYGIYPYQNLTGVKNILFDLPLDQQAEGGYEAADLLWAKAERVAREDGTVNLQFKHMMSRLVVNILRGENFEGDLPENIVVHIYNTATTASVDWTIGSLERYMYSENKTINMRQMDGDSFEAIVIPQFIERVTPLVEITMDGIAYLLEDCISFRPGHQHTINVTLNTSPDQEKIEIGFEGSVDDGEW